MVDYWFFLLNRSASPSTTTLEKLTRHMPVSCYVEPWKSCTLDDRPISALNSPAKIIFPSSPLSRLESMEGTENPRTRTSRFPDPASTPPLLPMEKPRTDSSDHPLRLLSPLTPFSPVSDQRSVSDCVFFLCFCLSFDFMVFFSVKREVLMRDWVVAPISRFCCLIGGSSKLKMGVMRRDWLLVASQRAGEALSSAPFYFLNFVLCCLWCGFVSIEFKLIGEFFLSCFYSWICLAKPWNPWTYI